MDVFEKFLNQMDIITIGVIALVVCGIANVLCLIYLIFKQKQYFERIDQSMNFMIEQIDMYGQDKSEDQTDA